MNKIRSKTQRWVFSPARATADFSSTDLTAFGEHMRDCKAQSGRLFGLKSFGEAMNEALAPRLISILVLFALVSAGAALMG